MKIHVHVPVPNIYNIQYITVVITISKNNNTLKAHTNVSDYFTHLIKHKKRITQYVLTCYWYYFHSPTPLPLPQSKAEWCITEHISYIEY